MIQKSPRETGERQLKWAPGKQRAQKIFVADVLFGSPNKNCAGAGICKVIAPAVQEMNIEGRYGCNRAIALVKIEPSETLVFQFVRHSMCRKAITKYFGNNFFVVEDPFEFHQDYWSKECKMIQPGVYPVARSKDFLTVRFNKENFI